MKKFKYLYRYETWLFNFHTQAIRCELVFCEAIMSRFDSFISRNFNSKARDWIQCSLKRAPREILCSRSTSLTLCRRRFSWGWLAQVPFKFSFNSLNMEFWVFKNRYSMMERSDVIVGLIISVVFRRGKTDEIKLSDFVVNWNLWKENSSISFCIFLRFLFKSKRCFSIVFVLQQFT